MNKKIAQIIIVYFFLNTVFIFPQQKGIGVEEEKMDEGKRWAICIGINDYQDSSISALKKAQNDGRYLGDILKTIGKFDYVYVMTDDLEAKNDNFPNLNNIRRKLKALKDHISSNDLVVFAFSGHGITSDNENYLVVFDSMVDNLPGTSLQEKEIVEWLNDMKVKKSLLLLDACREEFRVGKGINSLGLRAKEYQAAEVAGAFYSTNPNSFSYEDMEGKNGVFTKYVIEGLKGEADKKYGGNSNRIVTFSELASYVEGGVSEWALKNNKNQRPSTKIYGESYGQLALSEYNDENEIVLILDDQSVSSKISQQVTINLGKVPRNSDHIISVKIKNKSILSQKFIIDSKGLEANWGKGKEPGEIEINGGEEIVINIKLRIGEEWQSSGFKINVGNKSIMEVLMKYDPAEGEIWRETSSGPKKSGFRNGYSEWYELSLGKAPEGYTLDLTTATHWLTGDRRCGAWANCEWRSQNDQDVRFAFQLQGRDEWPPFVRESEGHLKAKYKLIKMPPKITY